MYLLLFGTKQTHTVTVALWSKRILHWPLSLESFLLDDVRTRGKGRSWWLYPHHLRLQVLHLLVKLVMLLVGNLCIWQTCLSRDSPLMGWLAEDRALLSTLIQTSKHYLPQIQKQTLFMQPPIQCLLIGMKMTETATTQTHNLEKTIAQNSRYTDDSGLKRTFNIFKTIS